ncbi:MAG: flagellar filament capping protein FliD [Methylovulum sp.]|nr:flagellar filament capping protein FliD [Methylovulum sp.]
MSTITSTGLGSGLDVSGIVTKLVAAERLAVDTRNTKKEADDNAKITAFGNFKNALSDFKSSLSALSKTSSFQKISSDSSDSTVITASALSVADVASYQMEVKNMAQSHALASAAYADPTAVVGTGSLTINFGTTTYDASTKVYGGFTQNPAKSSLSLTIDSSNNTLTGIRDAINNAKAGVTASVLNDGTGNRLVFKSTDSGVKNSLQIKVTETGAPGLSDLAFDGSNPKMMQTRAAEDALVNINGLDVSSSSNTVSGALKGVTFSLLQAQISKTVTVNVTRNNADLNTAISGFVEKYNALITTVNSVSNYDPATKTAGVLLGESVVQNGMSQIRSALTNVVDGTSSSLRTLSDVGISLQKDGTLKFDSAKFSTAQSSDIDGVAALFSVLGRSTDSNVQYIASTKDTKAGAYAVTLTQAATQATLQGGTISFPLTVDATDNSLAIKVNGVQSGNIALTQQTYATGADLASEIQSRVNTDGTLKANNLTVSVSYDTGNNRLMVSSKTYGSTSQVEITQGSATLGLGAAVGTAGVDVAGTIDGIAGVGNGQYLTSASGGSKGLKLLIADTTLGGRGTVGFSRGIIDRLSGILDNLLSSTGSIGSRTAGLQKDLSNIAESRTALNARMTQYQARLLSQFNAMDALIGSMQATSTYLTQQIAINNKSTN